MRTDGNPRLIEVRPAFQELRRPWPVAATVALVFLASGACWAAVIGLALMLWGL